MRKIRGKDIAMIFQDPMTSLNPVLTIGDQISESIRLHLKSRQERRAGEDRRHAAARAHPGGREAPGRLSAPVLRRHAPARDDRDGALVRSRRADRRRADDRARRHDSSPDYRADERDAAAARIGDHPDHPRPRRRRRNLPERARDVRRQHGRVRDRRRRSSPSRSIPYTMGLLESLPRLDERKRLGADRGPAAESAAHAGGLRVRAALPYRMPICDAAGAALRLRRRSRRALLSSTTSGPRASARCRSSPRRPRSTAPSAPRRPRRDARPGSRQRRVWSSSATSTSISRSTPGFCRATSAT